MCVCVCVCTVTVRCVLCSEYRSEEDIEEINNILEAYLMQVGTL